MSDLIDAKKSVQLLHSAFINAHLDAKRCAALFGLLVLQHEHEGHIDPVIVSLLSQTLYELEEQFSDSAPAGTTEDVPF